MSARATGLGAASGEDRRERGGASAGRHPDASASAPPWNASLTMSGPVTVDGTELAMLRNASASRLHHSHGCE